MENNKLKTNPQPSVSCSFTYEDLQKAFNAGCKYQRGEYKSWETYNKFTGNQQPNTELTFDKWYEKIIKNEIS